MVTLPDTISPGFIAYFLSQHRQGLSTNRIREDFRSMKIKGYLHDDFCSSSLRGARVLVIGLGWNEKQNTEREVNV